MKTIILTHRKEEKTVKRLLLLAVLFIVQCSMFNVSAQITIGGKVFGGARRANVEGHTYVRIGAENHDVVITAVYGGNDIAGTIGTHHTKPDEITSTHVDADDLQEFNTYVRTEKEVDGKHLFIGQLFGSGYGDYPYDNERTGDNNRKIYDLDLTYYVWNTQTGWGNTTDHLEGILKPEVGKAYVDVHGGTIAYVYGGGDNVTVTENTQICINNESEVTTEIIDKQDNTTNLLDATHLEAMRIPAIADVISRDTYQIARVFGGNNKAPMAIMPSWHLQAGKIENLYSGGNEGAMTSPLGLLLEINPEGTDEDKNKLLIDNVYGGCRKADVVPTAGGEEIVAGDLENYNFPSGLAARVLVRGGDINNVYGGNDITGRVSGGNAVGVYCSIRGSIYGGGNGSYPYTDNDKLENDLRYGDYYYNVRNILGLDENDTYNGLQSAEALNLFRPNAEQVSILVRGAQAEHPTIIGGAIYCGGNSATLKTTKTSPRIELIIGSNVIADNVFLGNNGENMIKYTTETDLDKIKDEHVLNRIAQYVNTDGSITNTEISGSKFNSMDLTDPTTFEEYMKGCAATLLPNVKFDGDDATDNQAQKYVDYSTYFGSFYCGGNVGSMIIPGKLSFNFNRPVIIYEKVVGGCNNADVKAHTGLNALYEGGITDVAETGTGDKIELSFGGLKIQPKRWNDEQYTYTAVPNGTTLTAGNTYYTSETGNREFEAVGNEISDGTNYFVAELTKAAHTELIWNTISARTGDKVDPVTVLTLDSQDDEGTRYEASDDDDIDRRLKGGNIYGGCYSSGHVNGNVVINLNTTIVDRKGENAIFDQVKLSQHEGEALLYGNDEYEIIERRSGVLLDKQGMDVLGKALNVFGGGYGEDSEIWGSTTINLLAGYTFQIFGGGEKGPIGRGRVNQDPNAEVEQLFNDKYYYYNPENTCTINVGHKDAPAGVYRGHEDDSDDMAEAEFIYGGAFFSPVCGNTVINLGNGRVFNTFAGSCNGDILGHTETYVGRNSNNDNDLGYPWVRDHIYGGNDLGGRIQGKHNFYDRVNTNTRSMVYNPVGNTTPDVTDASAYIEYIQGRIDNIYGGCYGVYDYSDPHYRDYTYTTGADDATDANLGTPLPHTGFIKPRLDNAFVNFKPISNDNNAVTRIYGAGEGYTHDSDRDVMQNRSYILIDIPQGIEKFQNMVVFGAGNFCGLGMRSNVYSKTLDASYHIETEPEGIDDNGIPYAVAKTNADSITGSSVIDLARGHINNVYGGSYNEGITRRTIVNVPVGSSIMVNNLFGGAYGEETNDPCDVYEATVNYNSDNATVTGSIYGGNNNERRTLYGKVNIYSPVWSNKTNGYLAKVYGAGLGPNTWSEYTEVNLNPNPDQTKDGAMVYEVYGGGQKGKVHNVESVQVFMNKYHNVQSPDAWSLGYDYYIPTYSNNSYDYVGSTKTGLTGELVSGLVRVAEIDDRYNEEHEHFHAIPEKFRNRYNANVIIKEGAKVVNYVYGGGYGADAVVAGTTYVALLGGTVNKDIYAAGTSGSVEDLHGAGFYNANTNPNGFVASTNVYIKGGTVRNVYGGGWRGSVGHAEYKAGDPILYNGQIVKEEDKYGGDTIKQQIPNFGVGYVNDRLGESHVIIGNSTGNTFTNGIPAITRNVYGGGEGGGIFGTAYVTIYNGRIGYRYMNTSTTNTPYYEYVPENDDEPGDGALEKYGGNVFGGGYVANSYVDYTDVNMYDGIIRGGLYGGGEIGPIGRGTVKEGAPNPISGTYFTNATAKIYKGGETHIDLYGGHVRRNVFGGGRGYDNWSGDGWMTDAEKKTMDLSSKGYVFGSTEVHIHGGEVGTEKGAILGDGNVFGGGDEGFVYSAIGTKKGTRVSDTDYEEGYPKNGGGFYYETWDASNRTKCKMSLDCTVDITPFCKVTQPVTIDKPYAVGEYVKVEALNQLKNRNNSEALAKWNKLNTDGIIIHNAVFAGGNITEGSDIVSASTVTVYGNVAASLRDVYNCDLISLGSDDIGGIYGDGNLTLADGFREIHIDNYGTDFYSLASAVETTTAAYQNLTERQKAYYQLKYILKTSVTVPHTYHYYECKEAHEYPSGTTYRRGQKVTETTYNSFPANEQAKWVEGIKIYEEDAQIEEGEYMLMDAAEQTNWNLLGVCSKYAGRPLNTIQRADMCGVFGSRLVLQGAQDRVPYIVDYTNYTINRVGEVSLNKRESQAGDVDEVNKVHGNYFGIYNKVKFLGNLTSDVFFSDVRFTDSDKEENKADVTYNGVTTHYGMTDGTGTSYFDWKAAKPQASNRNNGISHNKVALASGVYLEIKREDGESTGEDDWGFITGVVELDLINVMPGMGGGYVYARNEHGTKRWHGDPTITTGDTKYWGKVSLLSYNETARTFRRFDYLEPPTENKLRIETSGNFVHNTKQIVDDCYPNGGMYNPTTAAYTDSPAHYWFIKGSIYVYDPEISAYTGSANAYAKKVDLPLTISAASNGRLTLREVQPNLYAYYNKNGYKMGEHENDDDFFVANDKTYHLNDPISYWDYNILDEGDKAKFVEETYVTIQECKIGNTTYPAGYVMLPSKYEELMAAAPEEDLTPEDGINNPVKYVLDDQGKKIRFDFVFRPSNNLSHNTGFILTYDMNNPMIWNKYYTQHDPSLTGDDKLNTAEYEDQSGYNPGPTYTPKVSGPYGQQKVKKGQIIGGNIVTKYDALVSEHSGSLTGEQAEVDEAYVATREVSYTYNGQSKVINPGATITDEEWRSLSDADKSAFDPAKVCINLLQFSEEDFVINGKILNNTEYNDLITKVITKNHYDDTGGTTAQQKAVAYLSEYVADAYYCTKGGMYGGSWYEKGKNYTALETFSNMTKSERDQFIFNYDALNLLIDPTYGGAYGFKPQYDGYMPGTTQTAIDANNCDPQYEDSTPLDPQLYSATQKIDYQAEFIGGEGVVIRHDEVSGQDYIYKDKNGKPVMFVATGNEDDWLLRDDFENIPNEKRYYTPIKVTTPGYYYVVKTPFIRGDVPYTTGQVLEEDSYNSLTAVQKQNIDVFEFKEDHNPQKTDGDGHKLYKDKNGHETTEATDGEGHANTPIYEDVNYYYCRESYPIDEKGEGKPVTSVGGIGIGTSGSQTTSAQSYSVTDTDTTNDNVPKATIINQADYTNLPNFQTGFVIHGVAPTETNTLYVPSESDIYNLTTEKIITVIFLYEYEESDESGLNVTPVSERHIVNIHINFKSGTPEIGKLKAPKIVLPGTTLALEIPSVNDGALPINNSGWEIFNNEVDATIHENGKEYINNETPVYWYQNDYWIAYYAESQLGRAYSNSVQFKVANYHDIKKVMDDKDHHYYIDHKDTDYEPKIYINDYSSFDVNGLDMFKNLIDLTYARTENDQNGNPTAISGGALDGHMPMDIDLKHKNSPDDDGTTIQGGAYFEFFLHADQNYTVPSGSNGWTPIASGDECFSGNFHGDGHTISGINRSLFHKLCGNVYNVGVTGPFTEAGIANTGGGFVENCWIKSTAVSGFTGTTKAVFGNPTGSGTQVVNCYYTEAPKVTDPDNPENEITLSPYYAAGPATPMPERAFYNGTVAYDLNGFYLYKRYCDNSGVSSVGGYQYWKPGQTTPQTGYYASNITYCSSGVGDVYDYGYVEDRYEDGDFRYADGSIPTYEDERTYHLSQVDDSQVAYYPIWPDDYLFFGQMLTYGYSKERPHQDVPSAVVKNGGRLLDTSAPEGNRVYRAPAYFRSKVMDVAHFNPWANLAAHSAPKTITDKNTIPAYPNMTAIDFAGHNDNTWALGNVPVGSADGKTVFYTPLLDDDGLYSIETNYLTQNLLVYAPASEPANPGDYANLATYNVLNGYFSDPDYGDYYIDDDYRRVKLYQGSADQGSIHGHLVQSNLITDRDHLLVDKQDFNCPIPYDMGANYHMWYQRTPENYVGKLKNNDGTYNTQAGWESISLPFIAELVSTNEKGEITHFYKSSPTADNTDTKVGHEYWLREYEDLTTLKADDQFNALSEEDKAKKIAEAIFNYPGNGTGVDDDHHLLNKNATNTFLWNYYYVGSHSHLDANADTYQTYYNNSRTYDTYAYLNNGKPYIIGFPGERYYEFDLSGTFKAKNTGTTAPEQIGKQTISFVSNSGYKVLVSDDECNDITFNGYSFRPNYVNEEIEAGTDGYTLSSDGSRYDKLPAQTTPPADPVAPTTVAAFRPYFVKSSTKAPAYDFIVFSSEATSLQEKGVVPDLDDITESIKAYPKRGKIVVESSLRNETVVQIYTSGGALIDTYTLKPGETNETTIYSAGAYIVRAVNGRFTKKLSVK